MYMDNGRGRDRGQEDTDLAGYAPAESWSGCARVVPAERLAGAMWSIRPPVSARGPGTGQSLMRLTHTLEEGGRHGLQYAYISQAYRC